MKDSKTLLLLVVSVLLIFVSCALLWTWGFNFNDLNKKKLPITSTPAKNFPGSLNIETDIQKSYTKSMQTLKTVDSALMVADSLNGNMDLKLNEFYKLRNEIALILNNPVTNENLVIATEKVGELNKKIEQLQFRNVDIENENKRLLAMLVQLRNKREDAKPAITSHVSRTASFNSKDVVAPPLITADLKLSAMRVDDGKELETLEAVKADKFIGSFVVKNNSSGNKNAEVIVVIVQPNGKTLQGSTWDTGRFETPDGKKTYSCKLNIENSNLKEKRLTFSLNTERSLKGNYTMQLYHNGALIGKVIKTLI